MGESSYSIINFAVFQHREFRCSRSDFACDKTWSGAVIIVGVAPKHVHISNETGVYRRIYVLGRPSSSTEFPGAGHLDFPVASCLYNATRVRITLTDGGPGSRRWIMFNR